MNNKSIAKIYDQYLLKTYKQAPICLVKGKGSRVWDLQGKEYLDFFPGWAVSGLGHCHPDIVSAIKEQAGKMLHIPNNFLNAKQAQLAKEISKKSFPSRVFFCNSGAEATDGAIKFARKYGEEQERFEVITMKQSFHGRTLGALAATGQTKTQQGFKPMLQGFTYADFNDLVSVKNLVSDKTVAILLEPILGEGGVRVAEKSFLQGLRKLCDENDILLIFDEVQTGMGRTGKLFAYQNFGVEPDIMTLAKSLGGGVPIGAIVVNNRVNKEVFTFGTHGSTFGGNPLVTSAALAVFKAIQKKKLLKNTVDMGNYLESKLLDLKKKHNVIEGVRGIGLMRALELSVEGAPIVESALKHGLIINCTQEKILRIFPAMTVTKTLINKAVELLDKAFEESKVPA